MNHQLRLEGCILSYELKPRTVEKIAGGLWILTEELLKNPKKYLGIIPEEQISRIIENANSQQLEEAVNVGFEAMNVVFVPSSYAYGSNGADAWMATSDPDNSGDHYARFHKCEEEAFSEPNLERLLDAVSSESKPFSYMVWWGPGGGAVDSAKAGRILKQGRDWLGVEKYGNFKVDFMFPLFLVDGSSKLLDESVSKFQTELEKLKLDELVQIIPVRSDFADIPVLMNSLRKGTYDPNNFSDILNGFAGDLSRIAKIPENHFRGLHVLPGNVVFNAFKRRNLFAKDEQALPVSLYLLYLRHAMGDNDGALVSGFKREATSAISIEHIISKLTAYTSPVAMQFMMASFQKYMKDQYNVKVEAKDMLVYYNVAAGLVEVGWKSDEGIVFSIYRSGSFIGQGSPYLKPAGLNASTRIPVGPGYEILAVLPLETRMDNELYSNLCGVFRDIVTAGYKGRIVRSEGDGFKARLSSDDFVGAANMAIDYVAKHEVFEQSDANMTRRDKLMYFLQGAIDAVRKGRPAEYYCSTHSYLTRFLKTFLRELPYAPSIRPTTIKRIPSPAQAAEMITKM